MNLQNIDMIPGVFPVSLLFIRDDGIRHRRCVSPNDDISGLPQAAQDKIKAHWSGMDMAQWQTINHPPVPPPMASDVKDEARRRIDLIADADERADMALEWSALLAKQAAGALIDTDKARSAEIKAAWKAIQAIKAAAHEIASVNPIPADFAAERRWPS